MKNNIGIIINRLSIGFVFAFIYQIFVGIATSVLSLPLTGNFQDLFSGIERIDSEHGFVFILWWVISTILITAISLLIVKNKKYLSPYKQEKEIDLTTKITPITAIAVGGIISFLFFLLDLIIGSIVKIESATDVQAIYQAALTGDFGPLVVSFIFSIAAGFIIIGVVSKTAQVKEITKELEFSKVWHLTKIVNKKTESVTTSSDTVGLRPGELVHIGEKLEETVSFEQIEFDKENFSKKNIQKVDDCLASKEKPGVTWTNIIGLHDPEVIRKIGNYYHLHSLVQADIMNTELRPKIENHENYLFLILKFPHLFEDGRLFIEQISLIIGQNYVLSFQELKADDDVFNPIRERLEKSIGFIRTKNSDYLAYALTDAIIDHFYVILEKLGMQTESLEEELMTNPTPKTLQTIHLLKREMVLIRKSIWPLRETIDGFEREQSPIIQDATRQYIRDVYNHTVQVMDTVEGLRDMIGGMLDTYLSSVSNKMNEIMKTLTIIASIFIPITFIAGIYGTNFVYVPELKWEGSYFVMLIVMAIIVVAMLGWFKKKGWL